MFLFELNKFLIASFLLKKILEIRFAVNIGIQQYCSTGAIFLLPLEVINLQILIINLAEQLNPLTEGRGSILSFGRERSLEVAAAAFN